MDRTCLIHVPAESCPVPRFPSHHCAKDILLCFLLSSVHGLLEATMLGLYRLDLHGASGLHAEASAMRYLAVGCIFVKMHWQWSARTYHYIKFNVCVEVPVKVKEKI